MVWLGNGAGPDVPGGGADAETDINLEVSFSEQALIYKEGSKVTQPQSEADDRLPVSQACVCVYWTSATHSDWLLEDKVYILYFYTAKMSS